MHRKSEERSLGLVFENENTIVGMAKILEHLHEYVPNDINKVVFGGDQLTCERATGVQRLRQTGRTQLERLDGFLPIAESCSGMQNLPPPQNANAKVKKEWVYQSAMAILDSYVMVDIGKVHSSVEGKILKEICIQIMHKSSMIM